MRKERRASVLQFSPANRREELKLIMQSREATGSLVADRKNDAVALIVGE